MSRRLVWAILAAMMVLLSLSGVAQAEIERSDGGYFSLVDEEGRVIHQTGLWVTVGDEYITASNERFRVVRVEGDTAHCRYVGKEKMPKVGGQSGRLSMALPLGVPVVGGGRPTIAIYHTHNDESYVPSDGTDSRRGRGGIVDVGDALRDKLQSIGINAIHDQTSHEPHDPNAYYRSRRTATKLLKKGPILLVDIHRDSVPPQVYSTEVKGTRATKVKLVVGRQNANISSNLEFAKRLKAQMDQVTPGLSGGIFVGKGNYNQDLSPRAILVEVGADSNDKKAAEQGISLFAQSLPPVLGIEAAPAKKPLGVNRRGGQPADWTSILWVLVAVGVAYGAYVYLNRRRTK